MRTFVLSGCLLLSAGYLGYASKSEPILIRAPLTEFPMRIDQWQGSNAGEFDSKILGVLGVTEYLNRSYTASRTSPVTTSHANSVGLYIGYYESQRQGDSIHSPMNCLPGSGWLPVQVGRETIPVQWGGARDSGQESPIEINRYVVEKGADKLVVLYWYQSHGRVVASEYWGKFYMVMDAFRMNRTDAALVRVISPVEDTGPGAESQAERVGVDFVRSMFPLLGRHLPV